MTCNVPSWEASWSQPVLSRQCCGTSNDICLLFFYPSIRIRSLSNMTVEKSITFLCIQLEQEVSHYILNGVLGSMFFCSLLGYSKKFLLNVFLERIPFHRAKQAWLKRSSVTADPEEIRWSLKINNLHTNVSWMYVFLHLYYMCSTGLIWTVNSGVPSRATAKEH